MCREIKQKYRVQRKTGVNVKSEDGKLLQEMRNLANGRQDYIEGLHEAEELVEKHLKKLGNVDEEG